jgi:Fur family ferric uptake transcriptional regulator
MATNGSGCGKGRGLDLDRAVLHLRGQGLRLSRLKQAVLEQFAGGDCALSAEELAERIGLHGDLSPLYRCLAALEAAGVLSHLYLDDGSRRYDPHETFDHHHHHLVCDSCSAIERLDICGLEEDLQARALASGFELRDHSLTLHGVCPECRAKADVSPKGTA